jgi:hypothetical protein
MMLDTNNNKVVLMLEDPNGEQTAYELLDVVEYDQSAFGVFMGAEEEEGDVAILRLVGADDQKAESYAPVNDEALEQAVFDLFQIKNLDAFDFGGNAFDF